MFGEFFGSKNPGVIMTDHVSSSSLPRGWYLSLMLPATRPPPMAYVDPSAIYLNAEAFADLQEDLMRPFDLASFDLVCGIDAMGFPLAGALASRCKKGMLTVRKKGKLCVDTDSEKYRDYQTLSTARGEKEGQDEKPENEKTLELRKPAFKPGTRVLMVDQWIETGSTMEAACKLVERAGGVIAGIACVCIMRCPKSEALLKRYRWSSGVPSDELQEVFQTESAFRAFFEEKQKSSELEGWGKSDLWQGPMKRQSPMEAVEGKEGDSPSKKRKKT